MLAVKMNRNSVRMSGVQVRTHLRPTAGSTIVSRTNSTTASSTFIRPVGSNRCWRT